MRTSDYFHYQKKKKTLAYQDNESISKLQKLLIFRLDECDY